MSEHRGETRTFAGRSARDHRLASLLADMVPGAVAIRITPQDPSRAWPSPRARVYGADGSRIKLNRAEAITIARWITRAHPEAAWDEAYDFDLAGARMSSAAVAAAGRGR